MPEEPRALRRDEPTEAPGSTLNPDGTRNAYAVIIGINQYLDGRIQDLRYARADAEGLAEVLTDRAYGRFHSDNVTLLTDEDATQRNIVGAIGTQLKRSANPDDLACVFFAGHGATDPDPSAGGDGLAKYLLPHDADVDDLFASAVPMTKLDEFFQRIEARQIIFFLDACYSGGADTFATRSVLTDDFIERLGKSGEGRLVLTSCKPNEVSLENENFGGGHGLFSHYLLKGLKGDADPERSGLVTVDALYGYLNDEVPDRARQSGGSMSPIRTGSVQGEIFLTAYQTAEQREAERLDAKARVHLEEEQLQEARRCWEQAIEQVSSHEGALEGLRGLDALESKRRQVLVDLNEAEKLPDDVLNKMLALLREGPTTLGKRDRFLRQKVIALCDGSINVRSLLEIWRAKGGGGREGPGPDPEELQRSKWQAIRLRLRSSLRQAVGIRFLLKVVITALIVVAAGMAVWAAVDGLGVLSTSPEAGIYLRNAGSAGEELTVDKLRVVPVGPAEDASTDRPVDFEHDVRGTCLMLDLNGGERLEWSSIGRCPN